MSSIIVRKFGGAGLSNIEKVRKTAESLKQAFQKGHQVIAVVSAMGNTTDKLLKKAYEISSRPDRRELDMLISTGERVSMSLLTMALKDLGCDAISFTGSQAGVLTDSSHGFAKILEVKPIRIEESLGQNKMVVVAGFQGVDPMTKEITTLGRGGTDTTAVALSAHFNAAKCEIIKEVEGIFSADPNRIENAQLIENIDYSTLLHMCHWGAKALHYRSVEMAQKLKIPIWVGSLDQINKGTLCTANGNGAGMNVLENLFFIQAQNPETTSSSILNKFFESGWRQPLIIDLSKKIWLQGDINIYNCVKETVDSDSQLKISQYGYQCITFSGIAARRLHLGQQDSLSTDSGENYFFKNALKDQQLSDIYNKHFTDL